VLCASQPSITSCEGCQRKFCLTCLSRHRNELSLELDDLFNRRNELVEIINNNLPSSATDRCSCFDEINRWQNEMHANIDRIASTARDNIRQFLSDASKNVRTELDQISRDLQQRQKNGGYVEGDLNRLKQQLIKLNDTVQRFNEQIRIDTTISKKKNITGILYYLLCQIKGYHLLLLHQIQICTVLINTDQVYQRLCLCLCLCLLKTSIQIHQHLEIHRAH